MITHSAIDTLVGQIYAAGYDRSKWQDVCDELRRLSGDCQIVLHGHDLDRNRQMGFVSSGYDSSFVASYFTHYAAVNPWLPAMGAVPVGQVRRSDECITREELLRSEFYNDWLRPQDNITDGMGVVLFRRNGRMLNLSVNIRECDRDRSMHTATGLMRAVSPHLTNAFGITQRMGGDSLSASIYRGVIDGMDRAVFFVDSHGRAVYLNDAAQQLVREGAHFVVERSGLLRSDDPRATNALQHAFRQLAAGNTDWPRYVAIRPKSGGRLLVAQPYPLKPDPDEVSFFREFFPLVPTTMLVVHDPGSAIRTDETVLQDAFDFTYAEARLALAILNDGSIREYADANRLSQHTVRNQMRAVLRKSGARKQSELVRLLSGIFNSPALPN